jgi:hypothetical protein
LFGIIKQEGGFDDAGLVVQDCLHICNNILADSETCQRLFFAMGGEWIARLNEFFDPTLLESLETARNSAFDDEDDEDGGDSRPVNECWFDDPARLSCAIWALSTLYNSLSNANKKHQQTLGITSSLVVPSAAFWIARRGPSEMVDASLSLLARLVQEGNADVGHALANTYLKVPPAVPRKTFPAGVEPPSLAFGWKPLPGDERRVVSLLSLLAERYVTPAPAWVPADGPMFGDRLGLMYKVLPTAEDGASASASAVVSKASSSSSSAAQQPQNMAQCCLAVFESILASDTMIGDLIVQYVLAPPPPPQVDGMYHDEYALTGGVHASQAHLLETMRPLGLQVMSMLVEACVKVLDGHTMPVAGRHGLEEAERAANILAVVFIHGSTLAKELCTAITTSHVRQSAALAGGGQGTGGGGGGGGMSGGVGASSAESHRFILPMLLFAAGRTARSVGVAGYPLLVSILRMLACVASGCERAAKQVRIIHPSLVFLYHTFPVALLRHGSVNCFFKCCLIVCHVTVCNVYVPMMVFSFLILVFLILFFLSCFPLVHCIALHCHRLIDVRRPSKPVRGRSGHRGERVCRRPSIRPGGSLSVPRLLLRSPAPGIRHSPSFG